MAKKIIKDQITCTKCGSDNIIRSGMSRDKQRYQCKDCYSYFVPKSTVKDKLSLTRQKTAIILFMAGAQIKDMEKIFGVSYPTISKWIEPIQKAIEENADLKEIRRFKETKLNTISSAKEIPSKTDRNWLFLELDNDFFENKSVILSEPV